MRAASENYVVAKTGEGVAALTVSHYGPIFDRLNASFGNTGIASITREEVVTWLKEQARECEESTLRNRFCRVRAFFNWLVNTQQLDRSPCTGMKLPRVTAKEVKILTLQQTRDLFAKNISDGGDQDGSYRELLGRLALAAFVGLRNAAAAQVVAAEIQEDGLRIPAKKLKTRLPQFHDSLLENVMAWLRWSRPKMGEMTPRQYVEAKSNAFIRAGIPPVHNCLRHGFASYHVAAYRDPSRTSVIMWHTSPKQLWGTYKGIANQPEASHYLA